MDTIAPAAGGDDKIRCQTVDDKAPADPDIPDSAEFVPSESFWLSKDSEFDWFDRNAFLERKESTKGTNSKNSGGTTTYSKSNSQRFPVNVKPKTGIFGLPKTQKNTHLDSHRRHCNPANIRLFPKRSSSGGRAPGAVPEPSSPKVSCIGRVRSKKSRSRRKAAASARLEKPVTVKPQEKTGSGGKTGLMSRITSIFRSEGSRRRKNRNTSAKSNEQSENSVSRRSSVTVKPINSEPATPSDPPALGGMNRFVSGRRSDAWAEDIAGRRSTS